MLRTEFIPARQPAKSNCLLIALHGLGDSLAGYRWLPDELGLPWLNILLVNAPDPYFGGFSWYDFAGNPGPGILRSRQLLFDLLDHQARQGFPTELTSLFGFSQGCLMTVDVGFRYPKKLSGLIGVSGYVHEPEVLLAGLSPVARSQRMLFTHGTQDPLVPCAAVREQVQILQKAGLNITWKEFEKVHTIAGTQELDLLRTFIADGYPGIER